MKVGDIYTNKFGETFKVVEKTTSKNVVVEFCDAYKGRTTTQKVHILRGAVRNPFARNLYGVGYLGQTTKDKSPTSNPEYIRAYSAWCGIMERCYNKNFQEIHPSYVGCYVKETWHCFMVFAEWYIENSILNWDLDKDILVVGNREYGPETCLFLPRHINNLFHKNEGHKESELPVGVTLAKSGKYRARLSEKGFRKHLGYYFTPEEAHQVYREAKVEYVRKVAFDHKENLHPKAFELLSNWSYIE